jgi:hypothetical protein
LKLEDEQPVQFAVPLDSFVSTYTRRETKKGRKLPQKMTLTAYLAQRGTKAKALTKREADLLGIPFPLQCGWPRKYGGMEIEEGMLEQLVVHAEAARQVVEGKALRNQAKPPTGTPTLAGVQMPLTAQPAQLAQSPVPGFALRQAKRYRGRKPAPWA